MNFIVILSCPFQYSSQRTADVILLKKNFKKRKKKITQTLACVWTFTDWFHSNLLMIEITKVYISIPLWMILTFIQSHSCVRNQKLLFLFPGKFCCWFGWNLICCHNLLVCGSSFQSCFAHIVCVYWYSIWVLWVLFFFFFFFCPSLLLSWMFEHDCLDTCCLGCLIIIYMCFVFLYLHLFSRIHVSHGKALQKYAHYCYYY